MLNERYGDLLDNVMNSVQEQKKKDEGRKAFLEINAKETARVKLDKMYDSTTMMEDELSKKQQEEADMIIGLMNC